MRHKPIIGIYVIIIKSTSEYYIGQSSSIAQRWTMHISQLLQQKHHCKHLQERFNKYTITDISFEILEQVASVSDLNDRELHWYYQYQLTGKKLLNSEVPKKVSRVKRKKKRKVKANATGLKRQNLPKTVKRSILQKEADKAVPVSDTVA